MIVYVGIDQSGSRTPAFRPAPSGGARLAVDVVRAWDEFSRALTDAVQRGEAGEDRSQGHALSHDPALRAAQARFVELANRDLSALREVVRHSSHSAERALATQVLGYAADKATVVGDLVYGLTDPDQQVRNNAMRALLVIAEMAPGAGQPVPPIPAAPFITLLHSPTWTDRNKASLALEILTRHREPGLLEELRRHALAPLVEIARWKVEGHAQPGFLILARIANYSDEVALGFWKRGERETVIRASGANGGLSRAHDAGQ
jgi:hypothetical protein